MPKSPNTYKELECCFEQLKTAYTAIKGDNERLRSYAELLKAILEFHKIDYPPFEVPADLDF